MIGVFISLDYILINNSGLSKVHKNSFRSFLTSKMLLTSLQAFAVRFKTYKIMCHQNYSECNLLTKRSFLQSLGAVGAFPRRINIIATKVPVSGGFAIDWAAQLEITNNGTRA